MDKKTRALLELSREPVLIIKNRKILFANSAAHTEFPDPLEGSYASSLLPEQLLCAMSQERITASSVVRGKPYLISMESIEGMHCLSFFVRKEPGESSLISPGLINSLLSTLNTLDLALEHMADTPEGGGTPEPFFSILRHSYFSLLRKILNLDLLVQLRQGTYYFRPELQDLTELVAELTESVCTVAVSGWAEIRFCPAVPSLPAFADGRLLKRLLLNLTSNALANTPKDGRVTLRLSRQGDNAVLGVEDTGRGIPPEILQTVFSRYESVNRLDQVQSSGLGLSVVSAIARLHEGTVVIESREKHGTSVNMIFPIRCESVLGMEVPEMPEGMRPILTELADLLPHDSYLPLFLD